MHIAHLDGWQKIMKRDKGTHQSRRAHFPRRRAGASCFSIQNAPSIYKRNQCWPSKDATKISLDPKFQLITTSVVFLLIPTTVIPRKMTPKMRITHIPLALHGVCPGMPSNSCEGRRTICDNPIGHVQRRPFQCSEHTVVLQGLRFNSGVYIYILYCFFQDVLGICPLF